MPSRTRMFSPNSRSSGLVASSGVHKCLNIAIFAALAILLLLLGLFPRSRYAVKHDYLVDYDPGFDTPKDRVPSSAGVESKPQQKPSVQGSTNDIENDAAKPTSSSWPGWANIQNLVVFGDSYSDLAFEAQWPIHLANKYNDSSIDLYALAKAGATVDSTIAYRGADFVHQLHTEFLPAFSEPGFAPENWSWPHTLFAVWFGINDGDVAREHSNATEILDAVFESHISLLEELYTAGGRNFLFFKAPPLERAPMHDAGFGATMKAWNDRLDALISRFKAAHPHVSLFHFDTQTFFNQVLDDPTQWESTSTYTNVDDACGDMEGHKIEHAIKIAEKKQDEKKDKKAKGKKEKAKPVKAKATSKQEPDEEKECIWSSKQWLWHDVMHPTHPIHDAMALEVSKMLRNPDTQVGLLNDQPAIPDGEHIELRATNGA